MAGHTYHMAPVAESGSRDESGDEGKQDGLVFRDALTTADVARRLGVSTAMLVKLRRLPPLGQQEVFELASGLGVDSTVLAAFFHYRASEGLSWALGTYRQHYALSNADRARYLQMLERRLGVLHRSACPHPEDRDYGRQVTRLAQTARCSSERLEAVLANSARIEAQQEQQGDLIVLGHTSDAALRRWYFGSISQIVQRTAPCKTIVVDGDQARVMERPAPRRRPAYLLPVDRLH